MDGLLVLAIIIVVLAILDAAANTYGADSRGLDPRELRA